MSLEFTFTLVGQSSTITAESILSLCVLMKKQGYMVDGWVSYVGYSEQYGTVEEVGEPVRIDKYKKNTRISEHDYHGCSGFSLQFNGKIISPYIIVSNVNGLVLHIDISMRGIKELISTKQMSYVLSLVSQVAELFRAEVGFGGINSPFSVVSVADVIGMIDKNNVEDDESEIVAFLFNLEKYQMYETKILNQGRYTRFIIDAKYSLLVDKDFLNVF